MATGAIVIEVDNVRTTADLKKVTDAISPISLAVFLETSAEAIILKRIQARFDNEGDGASGPWWPLSVISERFRMWGGFPPSHPINNRTGTLRDWVESSEGQVSFLGMGVGAEMDFPGDLNPPDFWTEVKYETAQIGKDDPPTDPRPIVVIDENDHRLVREALARYLVLKMSI